MNVRYRVELDDDERTELKALVSRGKVAARKLKRAQILLAADLRQTDEVIAANVGVGTSTVFRIKRRFVEGNIERALGDKPRSGGSRKLSSKEEALLVATACSKAPQGRARWTLELLAGALVALTDHETLSLETVRRRLAENSLKPWRKEMWCIPEVNGEFVARMEDVLDLYSEPADPLRPVVSFDESPTQLIGEVRQPISAGPGQLERYDSEYCRNGKVNLFIFLDVDTGWRHVKVTDRRTCVDFAECMRDLVDVHYPNAERIRVVLDNLSTHSAGALYQAFEPEEARRILRRLEFHFVPKHASWLNMVEIEIGVLRKQCLDRRIESRELLEAEIAAWELDRNESGARIDWLFTTEKARKKMGRAYPPPAVNAAEQTEQQNDACIASSTKNPAAAEPVQSVATSTAVARPAVPAPTDSSTVGAPSENPGRVAPTGSAADSEQRPAGSPSKNAKAACQPKAARKSSTRWRPTGPKTRQSGVLRPKPTKRRTKKLASKKTSRAGDSNRSESL